MHWYWIITCSNTVPRAFVSSAEDLKGYEDWELEAGTLIEKWNPTAWIQCTDPEWDGDPDDALQNHLALPIYSPKLQKIIQKARFAGVQFLPIHVLHMNGSEIPGFAIANILNMPSAIDMERSLYDKLEEAGDPEDRGKVSIYKMVLKGSALNGYDIIRIREFHTALYVSERFKREFESAKCTGYTFKEVQVT